MVNTGLPRCQGVLSFDRTEIGSVKNKTVLAINKDNQKIIQETLAQAINKHRNRKSFHSVPRFLLNLINHFCHLH